jgi:hypothetical protein
MNDAPDEQATTVDGAEITDALARVVACLSR